MKRSKNRPRKKGFTLIELMLVVGIIGILCSMAIPYYQNVQSKAKRGELVIGLAGLYQFELAYFSSDSIWQLPSCTNCICDQSGPGGWNKNFIINGFSLSPTGSKFYGFCVITDLPNVGDLTMQGAGNIDTDPYLDWGQVTSGNRSMTLIQDDVLN